MEGRRLLKRRFQKRPRGQPSLTLVQIRSNPIKSVEIHAHQTSAREKRIRSQASQHDGQCNLGPNQSSRREQHSLCEAFPWLLAWSMESVQDELGSMKERDVASTGSAHRACQCTPDLPSRQLPQTQTDSVMPYSGVALRQAENFH